MNNNPGVLWDSNVIRGPQFTDDSKAWLDHQRGVLIIDFAGRVAEQCVRSHEVPFPMLPADGVNLLPLPQETSQSDLHDAWQRYHCIETYKPSGQRMFIADLPDLLQRFKQEYRAVCSLFRREAHRVAVIDLAASLFAKRRMTYDEARVIIERALQVN